MGHRARGLVPETFPEWASSIIPFDPSRLDHPVHPRRPVEDPQAELPLIPTLVVVGPLARRWEEDLLVRRRSRQDLNEAVGFGIGPAVSHINQARDGGYALTHESADQCG